MNAADAREDLAAAARWVADYLERVRTLPVLSRLRPGEVEGTQPFDPPFSPEPMEKILADLDRAILPGITHWNHPRFFGYFAISGSVPGIVAETICAGLNVNGMVWRGSPAATELEAVATRWLAKIMSFPSWFGIINDTASMGTLHALAAARHRAAPDAREEGVERGSLAVYASEEAHSSVDKAVLTLGLGLASLRRIPADEEFRMDAGLLDAAIEADVRRGVRPMAVVATAGTTSTTSVDPLPEIADVCARRGVWMHVDAAYAGAAAIVPELRWVLVGAERADSLVVNPHKWLFVPLDCSILYVREPDVLREALSVVPPYLRTPESVRNLMDYAVPLGRRFRALKLWMVIRSMGVEGIRSTLRTHVRLAEDLAARVEAEPGFELAAPVPLSVVNFRRVPGGATPEEADRATEALAEAVNAGGDAFVTTTRIRGRPAVHAAIGHLGTTGEDVAALWEAVLRAARA